MNNRLKPYDKYIEAGLPWLSKIPYHWEMNRNKNVLKMKKERVGESHGQHILLSLTKQGIIARDMVNIKGKFPKEFDTYQAVNPGDIIFCLFDIDETPRVVGLSTLSGMITGAYTVFEVEDINKKYLYYYYLALDNHKQLKPLYSGLRKVINSDTFLRTKMPYPPREEQDQIVCYLDSKLAKINKYINNKKKLIELLKEKKQAIINKAVTKGLTPNAKMKPSGIEWLGDIPEGWEVLKLKRVCKVNPSLNGYLNKYTLNDKVVFLSMEKISEYGDIDDSELRPISEVKNGLTGFTKNDVIIAKITPCFENGKGACLDDMRTNIGFGTTELIVLRPNNKITIPKFLYLITRTSYFRNLGEEVMTGSAGQKRVPVQFVSNFAVGLPDIKDQKDIVIYIETKETAINRAIERINKEIDLMSEYRTSLISNVVTGKVDVRNVEVEDVLEEIEEDVEVLVEETLGEEEISVRKEG